MKHFSNLRFGAKLLFTHLALVLITVLFITGTVTLSASNQLRDNSTTNLQLLTEQVLLNYTTAVANAERQLYSMGVTSDAHDLMGSLRGQTPNNAQRLELAYCLSTMIDSHTPYDQVTALLPNGQFASSDTYQPNPIFSEQGKQLLQNPALSENNYGQSIWTRTEDGEVYLIRDVYAIQPLRYAGKVCAHIRQNDLVTMSGHDKLQGASVLMFNQDGRLILSTGVQGDGIDEAVLNLLDAASSYVQLGGKRYTVCQMERNGWQAVGLMPAAIIENVQHSVRNSGLMAGLLGVLIGLAAALLISRQLSARVKELVVSMNRVAAGDLDVEIAVRHHDEIGELAEHFNRTTRKTRDLLQQIVQEENSRHQAEYMNLEYEYRFLQWQVNPHFIYNALESFNALAKIDGDQELSNRIILLSSYFRQNAEAIRKKFVTVEQEFGSLGHYAKIYCASYESALNVVFDISPEVRGAYLPTMLIQPLLENALVHGRAAQAGTTIRTSAEADGDVLVVRIADNGRGMTRETLDALLGRGELPTDGTRTSLGVRNVQDRLHLLYGDAAFMTIESTLGQGTCVTVRLPLEFEETVLHLHPEQRKGQNA